ncbi:MAG TPA: hypothetical protein VMO75_06045 [Chthoniobacterales bacterium]|jgi:hypothetical protein|nr:hypothetical protein [Chthoniobacterales bacterium]
MKTSTMMRASVAILASAAFLWALALGASPQLHERVHPDANRAEHACAVTFISSGNYDHTPTALLISAPVPLGEFEISELTPRWIQPVFLVAAIFEHAPPA